MMTIEEMKSYEIAHYCELQLIKQENGEHVNKILDYKIKESAAKLATYGVNLEELTLD